MRYFVDTEFTEDGHERPVDLLSIGIVAEDGRELHRVLSDCDLDRAERHPFVAEHVLPGIRALPRKLWQPREIVREEVRAFLAPVEGSGGRDAPQQWADTAAYDHLVGFAQLFGRMVDMPRWLPWFTRDIRQELGRIEATAHERGELPADQRLVLPEQAEGEHDALADARHLQVRWEWLSTWAIDHGIDPPQ